MKKEDLEKYLNKQVVIFTSFAMLGPHGPSSQLQGTVLSLGDECVLIRSGGMMIEIKYDAICAMGMECQVVAAKPQITLVTN